MRLTLRVLTNRALPLFAALSAIIASGCGGSGSTAVPTSTSLRSDAVLLVEQAAVASTTGTKRPSLALTRDPGTPTFDEYFQLWGVPSKAEGVGTDYFVEESLTTPAGSTRLTFQGPNGLLYKSETTLTKGPRSGYAQTLSINSLEGLSLQIVVDESDPERGSSTMTGTFNLTGGGEFNSVTQKGDVRIETKTTYAADGSYTQVASNNKGIRLEIVGLADGSATGSLTGNGEGLPATFVWNTEGVGEITWVDGSKQPLDLEVLRSSLNG